MKSSLVLLVEFLLAAVIGLLLFPLFELLWSFVGIALGTSAALTIGLAILVVVIKIWLVVSIWKQYRSRPAAASGFLHLYLLPMLAFLLAVSAVLDILAVFSVTLA